MLTVRKEMLLLGLSSPHPVLARAYQAVLFYRSTEQQYYVFFFFLRQNACIDQVPSCHLPHGLIASPCIN